MKKCPFCNINHDEFFNKKIDETKSFIVTPGLGSLVRGYVLIIAKDHVPCMTQFSENILDEYNDVIEKYRLKFKKIYGKYPIVFEHGTPETNSLGANSVAHAHTHIFNHNYNNEKEIIANLNMKKIDDIYSIKDKNYIYYKNPEGINYITYDFKPISQIMRIYVAKDLNIEDKYNWREYPFYENIKNTIKDLDK